MSDKEALQNILKKIDRANSLESVLESPQTEFEDDKLSSLDISDLDLETLPGDLFDELKDLEKFHASFNKITEIPSDLFKGMSNLKVINLYGNRLETLPDAIFDGLEDMEWLDLRSNNLEKLPKSLGQLDTLKYLFLQNNPLSEHPDHSWAADYHSKRDLKKFMPEFQEAMGLEVTMEKPLSRREIAEREAKKRANK